MKLSALILTGALSLNLAAMAVAAEAQQRGQGPTPRSGPTSTGPASPGSTSGAAVWDPTGTGGCTPGSPVDGSGRPCGPAGYPPYHYFLLPSDKNCLSKTEVAEPDHCLRFAVHLSACTGSGGTIERREDEVVCLVPSAQIRRFQRAAGQSNIGPAIPAPPLGNPRPGASPPRN